ncbi:ABC transporter ATP-binding protein [Vibrio cholerae]|uniref:ABC transporter ATP-binding protein n=1 Tax=Vibrio cholerae TaxID=666 RepID=UPI001A9EAEF4|nr:ABC transporter ATP-binding protein [Vibrio cholerae]MBO1366892.1 ABC transporter ATP-binding protein [Vibrio cholerae]MBO1370064.1 ABC transporter ATP-binding protein [Vibrio cholerae]MBO1373031.1 ABC transporter ATP-binding protein [Vibrio cholerae]MBO1377418.1 ABC transporter ATP-binding protein [Vibrio cholerae]MBO1406804.1 ABC transporter ATP-binding protein [Vibrio cholerae]
MGSIVVSNVSKSFKSYPNRWSKLAEWLLPIKSKRHSIKTVIKDVSFTINPGESVGIMGVNGAGKSTLLKMITGTTHPSNGSINIAGRVSAMLELGMGFHPDFTGRENVYMSGQLLGLSISDINSLMLQIEDFAEIGDYIDQPVRIYSSGMQVRLAFSVATAVRPDILIIDEALSVGDSYFQAKCYKRISEFKSAGTTLLLVSHSVGDVVKHCDRAILLKNGYVNADGPSRDVTNIYLDTLFGKKEKQPKSDNSAENMVVASSDLIFNGSSDLFSTRPGYNKNEHRWGKGGAIILDYKVVCGNDIYPIRIESGSKTDFYFKVRFECDYDSVVPGFLVKTLEGIFLYGTNSFVAREGRERISVKAGDIQVYKFTLPMLLNEGNYLISFGISSGDPLYELIPLERRYDSVMISVFKHVQFWGLTDLQASFTNIDME